MSQVFCKSNVFSKTTITSVARNTSWSRGWLRLVMQIIFGTFTICCFVVITVMSIGRSRSHISKGNVCNFDSNTCVVRCFYIAQYEREIAFTIKETYPICSNVELVISHPIFDNNIIPDHWMNELPNYVESLTIVGGNMSYISNNAFVTPFAQSLKHLVFYSIHLSAWTSKTLKGLTSLKSLIMENCKIDKIEKNCLGAVANTIKSVTLSAIDLRLPDNVTGSPNNAQLEVVNLPYNNFNRRLGPESFVNLQYCRVLLLTGCKIRSIREGTFDNMNSLQTLHLNSNHLMTLSPNLFKIFFDFELALRPKINLHSNDWNCNCSEEFITQLLIHDLLLGNPICKHPKSFNNIPFSRFEEICGKSEIENQNQEPEREHQSLRSVNVNRQIDFEDAGTCKLDVRKMTLKMVIVSPLTKFKCQLRFFRNFNRQIRNNLETGTANKSKDKGWLHPSFTIQRSTFSMMELEMETNPLSSNYGLIWYHSECPNEVYCFNMLPHVLRLYSLSSGAIYTFCPIEISNAYVDTDKCIRFNSSDVVENLDNPLIDKPLMYILTGVLCLALGAVIVYMIIRMNPFLLKGSKRLLFVKHKSVEALVLPPKVPLRSSDTLISSLSNRDVKTIYTISEDGKISFPCELVRSNSVRSDKSISPTYISVLQPTQAQLAEWRIRHHFQNDGPLSSTLSETSITMRVPNDIITHHHLK